MKYLWIITLGLVISFWIYDEGVDGNRIKDLEARVSVAELEAERLKAEVTKARSDLNRTVTNIKVANGNINEIIDNVQEGIDAGISAIQKIRVINGRYDNAVAAIRNRCESAIN